MIDNSDRQILLQLVRNARTPLSVLARACGLSITGAANRVDQLAAKGILSRYKLILNHGAFPVSEYDIYYMLANSTENAMQSAVKSLRSSPYTTQVLTTTGSCDIRCTMLARDPKHLHEELQRIEKSFGFAIKTRTVLAVTSKYKSAPERFFSALFGEHARVPSRAKPLRPIYKQQKTKLDDVDKKIITLLAHDARKTYKSIASEVGLTPEGVSARVQSLQKRNIIIGYTALLNGAALGYSFGVLLLTVRDLSDQSHVLQEVLREQPTITSAVETLGSYNMSFTFFGKDLLSLQKTALGIRRAFGNSLSDSALVFLLEREKYPDIPTGILNLEP